MNKNNKTNYIDDDYLIFDHKDIAKFINKNKHNIDDIKKDIDLLFYKSNKYDTMAIKNKMAIKNINDDVNKLKINIDRVKKQCDNVELSTLIAYCFGGLGVMFLINIITWIVILTK